MESEPESFAHREAVLPTLRPPPGAHIGAERRPRGAAGASDRGLVREQNEDAFVIADLERRISVRCASVPGGGVAPELSAAAGTLLAVADGLGGEVGGEIASAVTVDGLVEFSLAALPWVSSGDSTGGPAITAALRAAVGHCEARLRRAAARLGRDYERMGTTLTAVLVLWPSAYVAHVGDSRCYLVRDGALRQVTRDHTLAQALVDRQIMDARDANTSPLGNVLVNAIGGGTDAAAPDLCELDLTEVDELLLCTDGLSRYLDPSAIAAELAGVDRDAGDRATYCRRACEQLVAAANRAGGNDNVTVVLAAL